MVATVLVVPSCHFLNQNRLCVTVRERLGTALRLARSLQLSDVLFIVTGGEIPYEQGGRTMGALMRDYLEVKGVERQRIVIAGGVGTFSEARSVVAAIRANFPDRPEFMVITSDWQLWVSKSIWRRLAHESGLAVRFVPVRGTGGLRVRLMHLVYALVLRVALASRAFPAFERLVTKLDSGRRGGISYRYLDRNFCG